MSLEPVDVETKKTMDWSVDKLCSVCATKINCMDVLWERENKFLCEPCGMAAYEKEYPDCNVYDDDYLFRPGYRYGLR